jgi:hypothetical protein
VTLKKKVVRISFIFLKYSSKILYTLDNIEMQTDNTDSLSNGLMIKKIISASVLKTIKKKKISPETKRLQNKLIKRSNRSDVLKWEEEKNRIVEARKIKRQDPEYKAKEQAQNTTDRKKRREDEEVKTKERERDRIDHFKNRNTIQQK